MGKSEKMGRRRAIFVYFGFKENITIHNKFNGFEFN